MATALGVYKSRRFPFAPQLVYETWIDPTVRVAPISHMEADVRVGGAVKIVIESGGTRSIMCGSYLEVEPCQRLRYSWQWQHRPETTLVTVSFAPAGKGCRVTLVHEGFAQAADREAHHLAWDAYLQQLERALTKRTQAEQKLGC